MARIAVVGEALIDFTQVYEDGRHIGFRFHPGGSPYNVAIALARLGETAFFGGRISTDFFGRLLRTNLDQNGVRLDLLLSGDEPSPLAFITDRASDVEYSFRWHGTADQLVNPGDFDLTAYRAMDAIHFGSVELAHEPASASILELVGMVHGSVTVTFDPNLRAQIAHQSRSWRSAIRRALELSDIAKLSEADIEVYGGTELLDIALSRSGPVAVLVTRGERGSDLYRLAHVDLHCPASKANVIDAIGAGDGYMAGLLTALAHNGHLHRDSLELQDHEWLDAMAYASRVASLTCERRGADPPMKADLEVSMKQGPDAKD